MDDLKLKIESILDKYKPDEIRKEARELESESEKAEFWQNHSIAGAKMKKLSALKEVLKDLSKLEDFLLEEEYGRVGEGQIVENLELIELVKHLETKLYLSGQYDTYGAVVSIHSGQGGVEAMDWVAMLYRMYKMFSLKNKWDLEEIDYQSGEEAGIKEVVFQINGDFAYGMLKHEAGVHRLVRNSPFNANGLRQTSFALVEVIPLLDQNESANDFKEEDLEWDFFRSGGKGGQNVNKVSSAVRLRYKPLNIIVTCQRERSQEQNRSLALTMLKGKLLQIKEEEQKQEMLNLRGRHVTPGWGNQIRSYVLSPYHLVKDLRTEYEETNSDSVLDGNIKGFIDSCLVYFASDINNA